MAKTRKVVITRGVKYHNGQKATSLLPSEDAKKPNVVTLPESTAGEFIRTGHAEAAEDYEAPSGNSKKDEKK